MSYNFAVGDVLFAGLCHFLCLIPIYLYCRSLFVPYFKYLLESCVRHLTDAKVSKISGLTRKKKKAKIQEAGNMEENSVLSLRNWHLRALVISSLHNAFSMILGP